MILPGFSRPFTKLFKPGIATGWTVSQRAAGANMSVDIAVGDGNPQTTNTGAWDWTTAIENVVIAAASVTNRRDIIVAYTDISVTNPSTSTPNNPGALKFMVIAGTPAASPSDPSDATIQAAVGASNPFEKLARVTLTSSTAQITNAQITDLRRFMALNVQRLWGGGSNTLGHLVPNVADGTIALTSQTDGKPSADSFYNPYKFSAYASATVAISSVNQKVALNTERFDTNNNFDTGSYRYTAPVAGFYFFTAQASFGSAGMGTSENGQVAIWKNGAGIRGSQLQNGSGSATLLPRGTITLLLQLAAGDYIELYVQMGGVYRDIVGDSSATWMEGFLVSKT